MKLIILGLILSLTTVAQVKVDLGAGLTFPQTHRDFNNEANSDLAGLINLRYNTSERVSIGVGFYKFNFDDTDLSDEALYFLGRYDFSLKESFRPFAQIGAGFANVSPDDGEDYGRLTAMLGVGIDSVICDDWRLGLVLNKHHIAKEDKANSEQNFFVPSIFLTWSPGEKKTSTPKKEVKKMVKKDGDRDGVADAQDQCPNTKLGAKVNDYGCDTSKEVKIALDVKFLVGKTEIDDKSTVVIDKFAKFLKANESIKVEIQGHTDSSGSRAGNVYLSNKRASAVADYLVIKHGIAKNRIQSKGYGPDKPLYSNDTLKGRVANRRVEAKIID